MLALVAKGTQLKTQNYWMPRLQLQKMPCEICGLQAKHATWTITGDGGNRYVFMNIHCDWCYGHADFSRVHALKIEAFEQRQAAMRPKPVGRPRKLVKAVGE